MGPWFLAMSKIVVTASSRATADELANARVGSRFGRMDTCSQLALLAVEKLGLDFESLPRDRIAICLATEAGSLATDVEYWKGREATGGPSPTLFAYTLPSSALGEIAIRYQITGPNLCFFGQEDLVLHEGSELIRAGEAEAVIGVACKVITPDLAEILGSPVIAQAKAMFLQPEGARAT